jgi:hypothetical protein
MRRILFCLLISLAPAANALVITQSLVRTGQTAEYYSGSPLGKFGGVFQQFDPALGTLNSVNLLISGDVNYYVHYEVPQPQCTLPCYADVGFSTGYIFNAPGFPISYERGSDFFSVANWGQRISFDPSSGLYWYYTYFGHEHTTYSPNLVDGYSGPLGLYFSGSPSSLLGYIGGGTVTVAGAISEDSDYCDGEYGMIPSCSDYLKLTTTLTYTYTPTTVSEPPASPMFATGLALIAGLIWLRKRSFSRTDA